MHAALASRFLKPYEQRLFTPVAVCTDLFTAAFFGQLIESADPATPSLPGNLEFAEATDR